MALHIINENNDELKNYVRNKIFEYNMKHFPDDLKGKYQEIHIFLKDEDGQVCGGILGETCWNWLEIQYLFVEPEHRRYGYGKKLIHEAERIAKEKQCDFIKVDTLSFQALDFYKKEGFEVYGIIENAGRHKHYYMKKDL
ncbi:GNAT family N-acetyltransferase [Paenibacillus sp. DMB20]|uniref:GNAT family N-acetyltransferase n=1 Tax=Paenibacillus sp. DMB20 TaxID=1642570 RepID=UPI000628124C|nr:GNAT family N-acetyltransferase [Paenibacillus sp. DMB20]KKO54891.1 GNAT family acetyltransferase [Paenibacillus sp. DMB20]